MTFLARLAGGCLGNTARTGNSLEVNIVQHPAILCELCAPTVGDGGRCLEPLVIILHVAYAFVPLGLELIAGELPTRAPHVSESSLQIPVSRIDNLRSKVRSHSNSTSRSLASIWLPGVTCTAFTVPSRSAWRPVSIFIASMVTSRSPGLTFWPGFTLTPAIEPGIGAPIWLTFPSCAFGGAATLPFTCRSGTRMTRG